MVDDNGLDFFSQGRGDTVIGRDFVQQGVHFGLRESQHVFKGFVQGNEIGDVNPTTQDTKMVTIYGGLSSFKAQYMAIESLCCVVG